MLRRLTVKNYAIIRELDMSFGDGFTIITGETGAGKSILLGALGMVLGERADTAALLNKEEKCIVEAEFNIKGYDLEGILDEAGVDYDDESTVRREISPAGKSRAFINDTPVNLVVLKELGERLIDVHSQHQTLLLGSNMFQLRVLDAFAGCDGDTARYGKLFRSYTAARQEWAAAAENADRARADYDYYLHQLDELKAVRLVEGEQEEMEREQEMLTNAGQIKEGLAAASAALSGEDVSALSLVRQAKTQLGRVSAWMPDAGILEQRLASALAEIGDISFETDRLNERASDDPARLGYVTARLDTIYSLLQKHRCRDLNELLARQAEIEQKVAASSDSDARIDELKKEAERLGAAVAELASVISEKRKSSSAALAAEITSRLHNLGMPNARFIVSVTPLTAPGPSGSDRVSFLFSANRQGAPEELSKTASGGELSRVMLCLKAVLAASSGLPAIIFDEIDSGVSGEVASMVGSILSEMGRKMQVINITHLPQVASRGRMHYHVYKEESDHSTITRVRLLNDSERVTEVARLLSGSTITEAALHNARELLNEK